MTNLAIQFLLFILIQVPRPQNSMEISLPEAYHRVELADNTFGHYLRQFPFKMNDNIVNTYTGAVYWNQNTHYAILDIDVGTRDLQQCADAVMRLRAEYLYAQKKYSQIHFNFTNGQKIEYTKYAQGYRIYLKNNKVYWTLKAKPNYSHKTFRQYMNLIFSYAGTYSLNKELKSVENIHDIKVGDVFIQSKQPFGHAVIVMDVAENKAGKKIFLLAQSYMPAQEIHILVNPNQEKMSPWYGEDFGEILHTPQWNFKLEHLKRF